MMPHFPIAMPRPPDPHGSEEDETRPTNDRPSNGEGLPRTLRIRLGGEIRGILRNGARHRDPLLEVFSASSSVVGRPRLGVIVPRHGRTIVERNLLRRQLREIGRRDVLPHLRWEGCDTDVLVRSRPEAYDATFSALREALIRSTERLCSDSSPSA